MDAEKIAEVKRDKKLKVLFSYDFKILLHSMTALIDVKPAAICFLNLKGCCTHMGQDDKLLKFYIFLLEKRAEFIIKDIIENWFQGELFSFQSSVGRQHAAPLQHSRTARRGARAQMAKPEIPMQK